MIPVEQTSVLPIMQRIIQKKLQLCVHQQRHEAAHEPHHWQIFICLEWFVNV